MSLAVSMWCYVRTVKAGDMIILSFIEEAKRIGADGVELLDFFYRDPNAERNQVKEALSATEMPCPIFSVANNFAQAEPADRAAQVDRIRFGVDEAVHYGSHVVRVFAGDIREGLTYDQARGWIVDGLTAASDYAHQAGVKLALENHGQLAGRGDQVRCLIEEVRGRCGHDALGANPDTGNFLLVDQDSAGAMAEVGDLTYMCHFKDFAPGDGPYRSLGGHKFRGSVIGEGCVDLRACVRAVRDKGFQGWFSLEYEGDGDPLVEVEKSLQNARAILADH